jgi:Asp-tRNA(Asn)/Glu-tRNA(Gln) amidotransferase A subunit family amidase
MGKINHLPIGLTLMGTAWSDATLVAIAHGIEQLLLQEGISQ